MTTLIRFRIQRCRRRTCNRRVAVFRFSPARAEDGGYESAPVPRVGLAPAPPPLPRGSVSPVLGWHRSWCSLHRQRPTPGLRGASPRHDHPRCARLRMAGVRIREVKEETERQLGRGTGADLHTRQPQPTNNNANDRNAPTAATGLSCVRSQISIRAAARRSGCRARRRWPSRRSPAGAPVPACACSPPAPWPPASGCRGRADSR